ncbi:hypothetical protein J6590_013307 [Homalodisca vitripennis]|nr:hypothetical protein J6590_013307 [Homalodisca vitripennis]
MMGAQIVTNSAMIRSGVSAQAGGSVAVLQTLEVRHDAPLYDCRRYSRSAVSHYVRLDLATGASIDFSVVIH